MDEQHWHTASGVTLTLRVNQTGIWTIILSLSVGILYIMTLMTFALGWKYYCLFNQGNMGFPIFNRVMLAIQMDQAINARCHHYTFAACCSFLLSGYLRSFLPVKAKRNCV